CGLPRLRRASTVARLDYDPRELLGVGHNRRELLRAGQARAARGAGCDQARDAVPKRVREAHGARPAERCPRARSFSCPYVRAFGGAGAGTVGSLDVSKRVAVLVSGGGSNLEALIEASRTAEYGVQIVAVGADRDCGGLDLAREAGIPTFVSR